MEENLSSYSALVARAWSDDKFKQDLINDPAGTLSGLGVTIPEDVDIKVVEDSPSVVHLVIPRRPGEVSEEDIEAALKGNSVVMKVTPVSVCTGPPTKYIC